MSDACPDCKGTGVYTGFASSSTCETCGGSGNVASKHHGTPTFKPAHAEWMRSAEKALAAEFGVQVTVTAFNHDGSGGNVELFVIEGVVDWGIRKPKP